MTRSRLSRVVAAIASGAALAALLVGPPVLLATAVGWPLPRELPTIEEVVATIRGSRVDATTVMKVFAVAGWLAWLQVLASAAVEVRGHIAGRAAARVPGGGLLQPTIRRLVFATTLVTSGMRLVEPATAFAVPTSSRASEPTGAPLHHVAPRDRAQDGAASMKTVTVKPRDSLWVLGERHLGDGLRWRDIWALNQGKQFPDGRHFHDPDLIRPGWELAMPDDAIGLDPLPTPPAPPPAPSPEPAPVEGASTPATPSPDAVTRTDPLPGEVVDEPAPDADQESDDGSVTSGVQPAVLAAGSLLAAGLIAALGKLRATQLRARMPGRRPPLPPEETRPAEARLRRAATGAEPDRLDAALRALAAQLSTVRPTPTIQAVTVAADTVEILLDQEVYAAPGPFTVEAGGRAWTLEATVPTADVEALGASYASPAPALASVALVDDRQLLLDLEACRRVAITGGADAAHVLWSIGYSLATSAWADDIEVVVVGDVPAGLARLDRVRRVGSVEEASEELTKTAASVRAELDQRGYPSTTAARMAFASDPWTPVVLLVDGPARAIGDLLTAAGTGAGLAVVAAAEDTAGFDVTLAVEDGDVEVGPLGIRGRVMSLPSDLADDVDHLLTTVMDRSTGPPTLLEPVDGQEPEQAEVGDDAVLVNVLGPVEVVGGNEPIDRRRSTELFVYLTLHPSGVDESRLRAALWPESNPSLHLLNQTISRARACLGAAHEGSLHLPRQEDGLYRAGIHVHTDVMALETAYRRASKEASDEAMTDLQAALARIRGLPFETTKGGWEWVHTEGLAAALSALAADAAHCLAEYALSGGNPRTAIWAVRQGLLAAPGDEILYRDLMLAHDAEGNPGGVKAVMQELLHVVDGLEPHDSVHPETAELYDRLVSPRPTRASRDSEAAHH